MEEELDFDDVYFDFDDKNPTSTTSLKSFTSSIVEDAMKKSDIREGFELLRKLPGSSGKKDKPKPKELPEEALLDLEVLKMRSVLDPKRFYKKNDTKNISKDIKLGKVIDSPLDFYSGRLPKKQRKSTLVDELLADAKFKKDIKRRYVKIIEQKPRMYRKEFKKLKLKYKRKTKAK